MVLDLKSLSTLIDTKDIVESLKSLSQEFEDKIAFSTSLGLEDQVITHLIFSNHIPIRVFTLDTGRLFPETYEVLDATRRKYKKSIEVYFPKHDTVEKLTTRKGLFSFMASVENRKECCFIRKVEPLKRALEGVECWITGIRAKQSSNRQDMQYLEIDEQRQMVKYQPLLDWTSEEVESFIKENFIPYNLLHDKGFPSIGCQPCTRAVQKGEDERAGRWWWEQSAKECGLHG